MARQLLLLTTAVIATLGQTEVSTYDASFSTDGTCQNDTTALLQVVSVPETFPFEKTVKPEETRAKTSHDDSGGLSGPAGLKHQQLYRKDGVMTSMNDWHSSRDLARVWGFQNVTISPNWTVQIFSAVPVFGEDETYIALIVEHNGDSFSVRSMGWMPDFDTFVMFCAGPDGAHKTQVIARGHSWVCPWPREELENKENKQFKVFLEDKNGGNLGMVLAEQDPTLLGQYQAMACVRDIFYTANPKASEPFSGVMKQWVEWMEWSYMNGLEHFLIYTFEGTDLSAKDIMTPYLDSGIASRVHFQYFRDWAPDRQGKVINDCLYRAKNHAKWLTTSVDVDEYMVFPGKAKKFHCDHILKEQGIVEDKVASLEITRVRFARARPESFEISSNHKFPTFDRAPKQIVNVDNVYRTGFHWVTEFKAGTAKIKVDPKLAIIHHYRATTGMNFKSQVDYEHYNFNDPSANVTDETLQKDMPLLEAAIAKRFNIQAADVKVFLKNLAFRRPPDGVAAAAQHKMW